jgi:hypothetical protein
MSHRPLDDPLGPARGCLYGAIASVLLVLLVVLIIKWVF